MARQALCCSSTVGCDSWDVRLIEVREHSIDTAESTTFAQQLFQYLPLAEWLHCHDGLCVSGLAGVEDRTLSLCGPLSSQQTTGVVFLCLDGVWFDTSFKQNLRYR